MLNYTLLEFRSWASFQIPMSQELVGAALNLRALFLHLLSFCLFLPCKDLGPVLPNPPVFQEKSDTLVFILVTRKLTLMN